MPRRRGHPKALGAERRELEKQREEKDLRGRLAARREVRADIRGTIRYVYDTKASSDRLLAGDEVRPDELVLAKLFDRFER